MIIAMTTSCATSSKLSKEDIIQKDINEEFIPYVQRFMSVSNGAVTEEEFKGMDVQFGDLPGYAVGMCYITPFFRKVLIDRTWWRKNTSQMEREELIFHEFGHCVLFRPHTIPTASSGFFGWVERTLFKLGIFEKQEGYLEDGCPSSYMHPVVIREYCISQHYEHYLKELFNKTAETEILEEVIVEEYACKPPIIINWTDTWTKKDKWTLNRAVYVCKKNYNSCVHEFTKKSDLAYTVWCKKHNGETFKVPYTF